MDLRRQWYGPELNNCESSDKLIKMLEAQQDVDFDSQTSENQSSTNCNFSLEKTEDDARQNQTHEQNNSNSACHEDL